MSSSNLNASKGDFKSISPRRAIGPSAQYDEDDSYKQELSMMNTAGITPAAQFEYNERAKQGSNARLSVKMDRAQLNLNIANRQS